MIEKKKRLVELLREKQESLVESTITANGPLTKLGHHIHLLPGYAFPSSDFSLNLDDVRLLRGANISPNRIKWDDVIYWPRDSVKSVDRFLLKKGDVVLGMDRPWISSGIRVAELTEEDVPSLLLQRVCKIEPSHTLDKQFMKLLLRSRSFLAYFEPILTGVSVPHISGDQIAGFRFTYIELGSQKSRASHCCIYLKKIDDLMSQIDTSIEYANEFRFALITAAVTGQIDVATWEKRGNTDRRLDAIEEETTQREARA